MRVLAGGVVVGVLGFLLTGCPDLETFDTTGPDMKLPEVVAPSVDPPAVVGPDSNLPDTTAPSHDPPAVVGPDPNLPDTTGPSIDLPDAPPHSSDD